MSLRASCCQTALLLWPSEETQLEFAAEDALLAGINQDVAVLHVSEVDRRLGAAIVDDRERRPILADHGWILRGGRLRSEEACADVRGALESLAVVDLGDGELGCMQLLDAVD